MEEIPLDPDQPSQETAERLEFFLKNIKGQDNAVKALSEAIEIYSAGLNFKNRPIYVVLLLGPSGVGKTLLSELLAEYWFGSRSAFTKIECEKFTQQHSIEELVGSPPGYIGYFDPNNIRYQGTEPLLLQKNIDRHHCESLKENQDIEKEILAIENELNTLGVQIGNNQQYFSQERNNLVAKYKQLFDRIKMLEAKKRIILQTIKNFRSIILFDEIEKAHPTFYNLLLNIIDKGELRLRNGMMTKFNNSVILMTSNIGSKDIADLISDKKIGFRAGEKQTDLDYKIYENAASAAKNHFPPEFLGRIDKLIIFRPPF